MNIAIWLILAVNIVFLAVYLWFLSRIATVFREFRGFVTAPDEKTPSPLAQLASSLADIFARSIVAQLKATFMGKQSGDVRAEKAVSADIAEDMLAQSNPLISAALDSFPTLKKSLRRNPGLIDYAIKKFLNGSQSAPPVTHDGNGSSGPQISFKL